MTRLTVTLSEEQDRRLREQAEAKRIPVSELVREALDDALRRWDEDRSKTPGFVGIAAVELPYSAEDFEEELAKSFGHA